MKAHEVGTAVNRRAVKVLWHHGALLLLFLPGVLLDIARTLLGHAPAPAYAGMDISESVRMNARQALEFEEILWSYLQAVVSVTCFTAGIRYLLRSFQSTPTTLRGAFEFAGSRLPLIVPLCTLGVAVDLVLNGAAWFVASGWVLPPFMAIGFVQEWVFDMGIAAVVQERRDSLGTALRRGLRLLKGRWSEAFTTSAVSLLWLTLAAVAVILLSTFIGPLLDDPSEGIIGFLGRYVLSPLVDLVTSTFAACVVTVLYVYWVEGGLPEVGGQKLPEETWRTRPDSASEAASGAASTLPPRER